MMSARLPSRTFARGRFFAASMLTLMLSMTPAIARADTLDTILGYLVKAGVIDGAVADAKPLIKCLVQNNGNPSPCVNVQAQVQQQGKDAAKKFAPDDPKIQGVVQLVIAINKGDWVKVIDVAGLKVLLPLACDLGLATGGPLKGIVCKDAMKKVVTKVAEPAVREILSALASGKPDVIIWKLITLAGDVDLACALVPEFPGKDIPCSVLGKALAELGSAIADTAKYGAKIVVDSADAIENVLFGDDSHMPYDKYYALYWLPWMHKATQICVTQQCNGIGAVAKPVWDGCVDYFDSHNQYRSTARKTCDDMRDKRFYPGAKAMSNAMTGAGKAHAATLRPWARTWAVEDYGKDTLTVRKQFFASNCDVALRKNFPFPAPQPGVCDVLKKSKGYGNFKSVFDKLHQNCLNSVQQQMPSPTASTAACSQAQPEFIAILNEEKADLQKKIEQIAVAGCWPPKGWSASNGLKFECASYEALAVCYAGLKAGAEEHRCKIDVAKADAKLGQQLVAELGAKRCRVEGGTVVCTRPWKVDSCHQKLATYSQSTVVKPALKCTSDFAEFEAQKKQALSLLFKLNGGQTKPTGMKTEQGQGLVAVLPPMTSQCKALADPLAIHCANSQAVATLKQSEPTLSFAACLADPNNDGADAPCLVPVYQASGGPTTHGAKAAAVLMPPSEPTSRANDSSATAPPAPMALPQRPSSNDRTTAPVATATPLPNPARTQPPIVRSESIQKPTLPTTRLPSPTSPRAGQPALPDPQRIAPSRPIRGAPATNPPSSPQMTRSAPLAAPEADRRPARNAQTPAIVPPAANPLPAAQAPTATIAARSSEPRTQPAPAQPAGAPPARLADRKIDARSAGETADTDRLLVSAGCVPARSPSTFVCNTRSAFDRCESLKQQQKVKSCALARNS